MLQQVILFDQLPTIIFRFHNFLAKVTVDAKDANHGNHRISCNRSNPSNPHIERIRNLLHRICVTPKNPIGKKVAKSTWTQRTAIRTPTATLELRRIPESTTHVKIVIGANENTPNRNSPTNAEISNIDRMVMGAHPVGNPFPKQQSGYYQQISTDLDHHLPGKSPVKAQIPNNDMDRKGCSHNCTSHDQRIKDLAAQFVHVDPVKTVERAIRIDRRKRSGGSISHISA